MKFLHPLVNAASRVTWNADVKSKEFGSTDADSICGDGDRRTVLQNHFERTHGHVLGRIRHIEVKWLWLQQAVADGRFRKTKVAGTLNPADILTKFKGLRDFEEQLKRVNVNVMVRGSDQGGGGGGGGGGGESAIGGRASGGPRVVSWADALEEEQETRDINDAGRHAACRWQRPHDRSR